MDVLVTIWIRDSEIVGMIGYARHDRYVAAVEPHVPDAGYRNRAQHLDADRATTCLTLISKAMGGITVTTVEALSNARMRYIERNQNSKSLHEEAAKYLPGGNSRSVLHTAPFPISMASGRSCYLVDDDGHEYDFPPDFRIVSLADNFLGEYSAGLYGHSEPVLVGAIQATLAENGSNLGANTKHEVRFASLICERFSLDTVRFTNSGTEANLHALMAARHFTGRNKVVVFTGGYHGGVLGFSTRPVSNTVDQQNFVVAEYNDVSAAQAAIEQAPDVGAVLVEGMQGASGNIVGTDEFLLAVQASARKVNAVFILDEVLTSRLAPGGLQSLVGLKPGLTTLGKYLGGSLAFGALGGRRDIMAVFDPRSPGALPHSGTFNNNTVTMRAGYAGLKHVYTPQIADELNARGNAFLKKLQAVSKGTQLCFTGRGSLICSHLIGSDPSQVRSITDLKENETLKELYWLEMIEKGFWVARRGSLAISLCVPQVELDRFVEETKHFLSRYWNEVALQ
ncbi:hypothetical protein E4T44_00896 [Aureobasidium sp. EXF-8845]|nr:hypothetical protein E4T44_00896 [Aureobasidium sp. EXF-8845]KAI4857657.1 hypothetical protein E4T45_00847 [Aureobasidium sp. EXF-8846]